MNRTYRSYCRRMGEAMPLRHMIPRSVLNDDELIRVRQTAQTTDLDVLRQTAMEMFPERFQDEIPQEEQVHGGLPKDLQIGGLGRLADTDQLIVIQNGSWNHVPQRHGFSHAAAIATIVSVHTAAPPLSVENLRTGPRSSPSARGPAHSLSVPSPGPPLPASA